MAEAGYVPPPGSYVWGSLMVATGKAGDPAGVQALWSAATSGLEGSAQRSTAQRSPAQLSTAQRGTSQRSKDGSTGSDSGRSAEQLRAGLLAAYTHALNCCGQACPSAWYTVEARSTETTSVARNSSQS